MSLFFSVFHGLSLWEATQVLKGIIFVLMRTAGCSVDIHFWSYTSAHSWTTCTSHSKELKRLRTIAVWMAHFCLWHWNPFCTWKCKETWKFNIHSPLENKLSNLFKGTQLLFELEFQSFNSNCWNEKHIIYLGTRKTPMEDHVILTINTADVNLKLLQLNFKDLIKMNICHKNSVTEQQNSYQNQNQSTTKAPLPQNGTFFQPTCRGKGSLFLMWSIRQHVKFPLRIWYWYFNQPSRETWT